MATKRIERAAFAREDRESQPHDAGGTMDDCSVLAGLLT
jgi:hypothetical protein